MNLISFASFTQSDNQTAFLPPAERDSKNDDFSTILQSICLALQTAGSSTANFSTGFGQENFQVQTISENGQNFVVGNTPVLPENSFGSASIFLQNTGKPVLVNANVNQTNLPSAPKPEGNDLIPDIKPETPNPTFKTDSTISYSATEGLLSIPNNFQPVPKLPTMQDFLAENTVDSNQPSISSSQKVLPEIQIVANPGLILPNHQESANPKTSEDVKGFEIVQESENVSFFSKQKFSLVTELRSDSKITEENIFPKTSNLPNVNLLAEDNLTQIEAAYAKNPEAEQIGENNVNEAYLSIPKEKIDSVLKIDQIPEVSHSNQKPENLKVIPKLNSVFEYPVKEKFDTSQDQETILKQSPKANLAENKGFDLQLDQKSDLPQDISNQQTIEVEHEYLSTNSLPQEKLQNSASKIETNFELNQVDQIKETDPEPSRKTEIPSVRINNVSAELNFSQNTTGDLNTEIKQSFEAKTEAPIKILEAESSQLNSNAELPKEISTLEFKESSAPALKEYSAPDEVQIETFTVSNKTQSDNGISQNKLSNFITQNEEKPVENQTITNASLKETLSNNLTDTDSLNVSLPLEQTVFPKPSEELFSFETKNTESGTFTNVAEPENTAPQLNAEKTTAALFTENTELPEREIVLTKTKTSENNLVSNTQNQIQNSDLPKDQKQTHPQDISINESIKTEDEMKISETNSSGSAKDFNLSEKSEQEHKLHETENDLTINFDKVFENILKKKEIAEPTLKSSTETNKIAEQITPRLMEMADSVEKKDEKEILRLRLHPAELGTVEITLERDKSGVLNAHFKTENQGAEQALSNGLEQLRDNLQKAGWEIGQLGITNGSSSTTDNQNRQNNQPKSEWIENFIFNRNSEQPDESENHSPARLLNLLA